LAFGVHGGGKDSGSHCCTTALKNFTGAEKNEQGLASMPVA
jgi:hypothetical protein